MHVSAIALLLTATAAAPSAWEKQSRAFFERFIDLKIQNDLLVVQTDPKGGGSAAVYSGARSAFPNVGRLYVRYAHGSSSSSRGGSGNVTIHFEPSGQAGNYHFQLDGPSGTESITLKQQTPGELSIEYKKGRYGFSYSQSKGKCKLRIRGGAESLSAAKRTFGSVLQENPDVVRRRFLDVLERYFDDVPVPKLAGAPPGKVVLHLQDGGQVIGELKVSDVQLETDYGVLTLPRDEIRQIVFPDPGEDVETPAEPLKAVEEAEESVVVTTRFTPKGVLKLDALTLDTPYGELRFRARDLRQAVFGPPLEGAADESAASRDGEADL